MTCQDCKCRVVEGSPQVWPSARREGSIALVFDAPTGAEALGRTVFHGSAGEVLEATIRAVVGASGRRPPRDLLDEVSVYHAVSRPTPGGKPPRIADVRACHDRLIAELDADRPRVVLAVGAAACASLAGVGQDKIVETPITRWRGQMRWLDLPSGRVPWMATISPASVVVRTDYYRDLSADVWKAWTQPEPQPDPDVEVVVARDLASLRGALAVLDEASAVSCDVETGGLAPWRDRLLSVAFGAVGEDPLYGYSVVVPYELMGDPEVVDLCWDYVFRATRRTIYQNGKFDLQFLVPWLGETDVPREAAIGDTLLLGYLLDERSKLGRFSRLGLKEQASYRYDKQDYHWDWGKFYADMRHDGTYPPGRPDARVRTCDRATCKYDHSDGYDVVRASRGLDPWVPPRDVADLEGMYRYQSLDVYYTARLWQDLLREVEEEGSDVLRAHDEVLVPAMKVISMCELRGAPLDLVWLRTYAARLRRRIAVRDRALASGASRMGAPDGFEHGSPAKVADQMYDSWGMTPDVRKHRRKADAGKPDRSTDKEHIEAAIKKYLGTDLDRQARWLRALLRWRTEAKQLSTYSETLIGRADPDGRIHASFWLHGTITGRLSSSEPNLQNIPAVDKREVVNGRPLYTLRGARTTHWPARRGFAPRPGYSWVEADYSQLELRVAAWLSGDDRLKQVFVEGRDIHLEVAATMFSKDPADVTKPERYLAKAVDFGILYGRQGKAIAEGEEMEYYEREMGGRRWDVATAEAFVRKFLRGYPQLGAWLETNAAEAVERYYVETPFGRRRRFPFKPRTKWDLMAIQRQANNTPIQSVASDLCILAMWNIQPLLPDGASLLLPVHDSICVEARHDLVDEIYHICKSKMEIELPGGVPLTIDFEVGPSWADITPYEPARRI